MQQFFDMDGYGIYVWPCYAVSIVVLAGLVIWTWRQYVRANALLAKAEQPTSGARRTDDPDLKGRPALSGSGPTPTPAKE